MSKINKVYLFMCITITVLLLMFAVFGCLPNLQRLVSAFVDFGISVAYYGCEFFAILFDSKNPITVTVTQLPTVESTILFPQTFEGFKQTFERFGTNFFTEKNFYSWLDHLGDVVTNISIVSLFLVPIILILVLLMKLAFSGKNNNYDEKTKPLVRWLKFEDKFVKPVGRFLQGFWAYLERRYVWQLIWKIMLFLALNLATMVVELLAYLLYFAVSIDVGSLYTQVYKLVADVFLMFQALPTFVWILLAWIGILKLRKSIALDRLNHFEMRNKGYCNSLGVCTMFTGNMGVGKTKLMTSVALSLSTVYKHKAKDIILKVERWFPEFPWATYQFTLRKLIYFHKIYNLTTCEDFVALKKERFAKTQSGDVSLYGYDVERYGLTYNNELEVIELFSALDEYTKAFFIYYLPKSILLGNYSIREDGLLQDEGNLPMWDYDFFSRNPQDELENSYYANILDFDVLRRGKLVDENNPLADTFEFGIVTVTELDKERGNTQDNKELKKMVDVANQKNDLFNYSPKMGRHPATVLYNPFVNFLFDQQRPEKIDADLRQICDKVINIEDVHKNRLALPFFFVEEILYSIFAPLYNKVYEKYRFNRADNSLSIYLFKHTFGRFVNWYERIYNAYGYDVYTLASDTGKLEGTSLSKDKYFLMYKKDLANRYSTDCYREFFRNKTRQKDIGIVDYPTFGGVKATTDELLSMNSYFIRDMNNVFNDDENKE